jgi:hypothetical protein
MDRKAYDIATKELSAGKDFIKIGNRIISLDEGREMVQDFLGRKPKYPIDVLEDLNSAKKYFSKLLQNYHQQRN